MSAKPSPERLPALKGHPTDGARRNQVMFAAQNPLHLHRPVSTAPSSSRAPFPPPAPNAEVEQTQKPSQQPPHQQSPPRQPPLRSGGSDTSGAELSIRSSASEDESLVRSPSGRQWRLDHSQFEAARKDFDSEGSMRRWSLRAGMSDPVMGYYRRQNEMIDGFSEMDALSEHLLPVTKTEAADADRLARGERLAIQLSNIFNIILLVAKIFASVQSRSLAIIASTLDSLLDCLSGFILWYTARSMQTQNPYKYPIGKKRMQPLGIIVFACIMAMLGLQILIEAVRQLFESTHNAGLGNNWGVYVGIMVMAIFIKLGLYLYCRLFSNEIVQAYSQDHFFDVVTNVVGLGAAVLAGAFAWWIDPLGAILLSLYTMVNWSRMVYENVKSLTGQSAPPEYLQKLTYLCWNHHEAILMIDTVRAYTFGSSYFTEVDVVLPRNMPLQEAHDIGESLQNKLETIPEIERAFVHLDYEVSHRPEHHHAHAHFKAPPGGPSVGSAPELPTSPPPLGSP